MSTSERNVKAVNAGLSSEGVASSGAEFAVSTALLAHQLHLCPSLMGQVVPVETESLFVNGWNNLN